MGQKGKIEVGILNVHEHVSAHLAEKLLMIASLPVKPPQYKPAVGAANVGHQDHIVVSL